MKEAPEIKCHCTGSNFAGTCRECPNFIDNTGLDPEQIKTPNGTERDLVTGLVRLPEDDDPDWTRGVRNNNSSN